MQETVVDEKSGFWIRARLVNVPQSPDMTSVERLKMRIEILGEGIVPTKVLTQTVNDDFLPVDMVKAFIRSTKNRASKAPSTSAMTNYLATKRLGFASISSSPMRLPSRD